MKYWVLAVLATVSGFALGDVLVLEYEVADDDHLHGASVEWIACQNAMSTCQLQYAPDFNTDDFFTKLNANLEKSHIVNMSFTVQKPERMEGDYHHRRGGDQASSQQKYEEAVATYERDSQIMADIIRNHPDQLFIAAAGNGVPIGPFMSSGVALKKNNHLYPQVLESPNLIKVAALDIESFDLNNPGDYNIADYSNHGLFYVELAAPVEPNHLGEVLDGSSFAAPYVARVTEEIRKNHSWMKPEELRNVLIRSCHVKDIEQALWATKDLLSKGMESIVYKAMVMNHKENRMALRAEVIPNVTLVQCGGAFSRQLAMSCAENYSRGTYRNVDQACLASHRELTGLNGADQIKLRKMWDLRFAGSFEERVKSHTDTD